MKAWPDGQAFSFRRGTAGGEALFPEFFNTSTCRGITVLEGIPFGKKIGPVVSVYIPGIGAVLHMKSPGISISDIALFGFSPVMP